MVIHASVCCLVVPSTKRSEREFKVFGGTFRWWVGVLQGLLHLLVVGGMMLGAGHVFQ